MEQSQGIIKNNRTISLQLEKLSGIPAEADRFMERSGKDIVKDGHAKTSHLSVVVCIPKAAPSEHQYQRLHNEGQKDFNEILRIPILHNCT